jgi:hypothetical protein
MMPFSIINIVKPIYKSDRERDQNNVNILQKLLKRDIVYYEENCGKDMTRPECISYMQRISRNSDMAYKMSNTHFLKKMNNQNKPTNNLYQE